MAFRLRIYESEFKEIERLVLRYPDIETGGDLFGLWTSRYDPVVQLIIGPGENCRRTSVSFHQDTNYLQNVGTYVNKSFMLCHIGSWHSHHQLSLYQPSAGDHSTVRNNYPEGLERYIMVIANIVRDYSRGINATQVVLNPYMFTKRGNQCDSGEVDIIRYTTTPFRELYKVRQIIDEGAETTDDDSNTARTTRNHRAAPKHKISSPVSEKSSEKSQRNQARQRGDNDEKDGKVQWYTTVNGQVKLKKINAELERIRDFETKSISYHNRPLRKIEYSRDKISQDLQLTFVHNYYHWFIVFPRTFGILKPATVYWSYNQGDLGVDGCKQTTTQNVVSSIRNACGCRICIPRNDCDVKALLYERKEEEFIHEDLSNNCSMEEGSSWLTNKYSEASDSDDQMMVDSDLENQDNVVVSKEQGSKNKEDIAIDDRTRTLGYENQYSSNFREDKVSTVGQTNFGYEEHMNLQTCNLHRKETGEDVFLNGKPCTGSLPQYDDHRVTKDEEIDSSCENVDVGKYFDYPGKDHADRTHFVRRGLHNSFGQKSGMLSERAKQIQPDSGDTVNSFGHQLDLREETESGEDDGAAYTSNMADKVYNNDLSDASKSPEEQNPHVEDSHNDDHVFEGHDKSDQRQQSLAAPPEYSSQSTIESPTIASDNDPETQWYNTDEVSEKLLKLRNELTKHLMVLDIEFSLVPRSGFLMATFSYDEYRWNLKFLDETSVLVENKDLSRTGQPCRIEDIIETIQNFPYSCISEDETWITDENSRSLRKSSDTSGTFSETDLARDGNETFNLEERDQLFSQKSSREVGGITFDHEIPPPSSVGSYVDPNSNSFGKKYGSSTSGSSVDEKTPRKTEKEYCYMCYESPPTVKRPPGTPVSQKTFSKTPEKSSPTLSPLTSDESSPSWDGKSYSGKRRTARRNPKSPKPYERQQERNYKNKDYTSNLADEIIKEISKFVKLNDIQIPKYTPTKSLDFRFAHNNSDWVIIFHKCFPSVPAKLFKSDGKGRNFCGEIYATDTLKKFKEICGGQHHCKSCKASPKRCNTTRSSRPYETVPSRKFRE